MIQLFLDNKRIHISSDQQIKLSRENPNVTEAGDYTLDVICPLSIYDNKVFFGSWQRIDSTKEIKHFAARLLVDNICVLFGSAKITGISNEHVKIQLFGDRSEFNALFGDLFIDELNLPYLTGSFGGQSSENKGKPLELDRNEPRWQTFVYNSVYNEAADKVMNEYGGYMRDGEIIPYQSWSLRTPEFNLLFVVKSVFQALGYKIDVREYDIEPFNHIMVANCVFLNQMKKVLPHWTLKQFVEQLELFFNCAFIFSSSSMDVKMTYVGNREINNKTTLNNEDVFSIEVDEENTDARTCKDLHYAMSSSEYHDTDIIDKDKIKNLPTKEFESYDKMIQEFNAMSEHDKNAFLFKCPDGYYCSWIYAGKEPKDKLSMFIHVNQFGDLIKDEDNDHVELKICPVAIAENIAVPIKKEHSTATAFLCYQTMPSMPGTENIWQQHDEQPYYDTDPFADGTIIQQIINDGNTAEPYKKPDIMEIFFFDGTIQQAKEYEFTGKTIIVNADAVFTAHDHKNVRGIEHKKWSLGLNQDRKDVTTIGRLHNIIKIKKAQKYAVNFLSDVVPNASDIFIIKNKKFIAEKIEITFRNGKMSNLMTGYFYEMT